MGTANEWQPASRGEWLAFRRGVWLLYECVNGGERQPAISRHRNEKEKGVYSEC